MERRATQSGFTLIEIIVVSAVLLLFFGGIMLAIQYSLQLISLSRVKISALSVATDRMELVRSLPYTAIGVVAGFPAGPIPQVETIVFNGFTFTVTTAVQYVDDPADGSGAADGNGITTDYKQIEVTVAWTVRGESDQVYLKSYATPRAIETNVGGGTVRVNVFDASVTPVSGASVRVFNESGIVYDVTRLTDASGAALFSVASGSDYQISVTRPGFSQDGTTVPTTTIPNPSANPITVLESGISTMNFFIDRTSTMQVRLLTGVSEQAQTIDLTTPFNWATSTNLEVTTAVSLNQVGGVYETSGFLMSNPIAPAVLSRWEYAVVVATTSPLTGVRYRFYTSTSSADRIPDADLPGNSAGFTTRVVTLRQLDATTYPQLVVGLELHTTDTSVTPLVDSLIVRFVESETPATGQSFTLVGQKVVGTSAALVPIPKIVISTSTDLLGQRLITPLEWDTYHIQLPPSLVITEMCPPSPLQVAPNTIMSVTGVVQSATTHSLRVVVTDAMGAIVPAATVRLLHGGSVIRTGVTTGCGQVFFSGLVSHPDYRLEIASPDLGVLVNDPLAISGHIDLGLSY